MHGMVWTCNFAVCHQVEGQEHLRSPCLRIKSKWRWQTISNSSNSPALHTWRLNRVPLQPLEICLFLAFAHNIDHRVTKTIAPHTFKKIHSLCKHSLSLAQYIMCEKEEGNERRSLKIKFSVFALSFGVFYRLPGSRWKPIQSYRCFKF